MRPLQKIAALTALITAAALMFAAVASADYTVPLGYGCSVTAQTPIETSHALTFSGHTTCPGGDGNVNKYLKVSAMVDWNGTWVDIPNQSGSGWSGWDKGLFGVAFGGYPCQPGASYATDVVVGLYGNGWGGGGEVQSWQNYSVKKC
jgi:hypothetical protein